jgi:hypothetical protein
VNLAAILRPFSRVSKAIAVALAIAACVFIISSMKVGALTQTVSVPASSGDTEMRSAKATTNYGSATTVTVNRNEPAGTGNDVYGLVKFPLTNVPAGVTVTDVKLRLNITKSSTQAYSAFALKRAWVEDQATWRIWKAGTKWQTAGATGTNDRESTTLFTITPNATGVQTYNLGAAAGAKVQAWINNPATNNGFILANSSNTEGFNFSSRETANSPALIITYDDDIQSDTTPPETTIASGPSEGSTVTSSDASFAFSSSESGSSFECSLDDSAFASCSFPKSYANLSEGSHTFAVRATDAPGNTDATPATSTLTPLETVTNVRDFGATGNGTSNDTAAFESAMAEAARVGGVVYVPAPGNYRIASVTPPNNTHLEVQAGAVLKKYGTKSGPLFNIAGPNDTTFANNIHIEGVDGTFTMDLNDAGQETAGIRYRNVRNFSLRNMVCIQNNDNPSQGAPSSRRPCLAFLPTTMTPTNGVYNHPIDGEFSNVHSKKSPYGWGLTQFSGGENLRFFDISSEGGVPLRLEIYRANFTPIDNIVADGVRCTNGHNAVHMNPHGATHGTVTIQDVVANSCESALSLKQDSDLGGSFASDSTISGVTVIPGNQAQLRDDAITGDVGAWIIGPSKWCIDKDDPLDYTIGLSNVDCGGLSYRHPDVGLLFSLGWVVLGVGLLVAVTLGVGLLVAVTRRAQRLPARGQLRRTPLPRSRVNKSKDNRGH